MAEFFQLSVDEVIKDLATDGKEGLTAKEAKKRLDVYGANALPRDEEINWFKLIWGQFNDPLIWLLIFAALVSAFLGEYIDFIVIAVIVVLNAALGIYQEFQAEQALAALSAMQVPQVSVKRGGTVTKVSAEDLVPGDLVLLEEGDSIPADGRLIETNSMRTMEAALTGESLPVGKTIDPISESKVAVGDRKNMVFMGTALNSGRGAMIVTTTGLKTELGEIADLLTKVETGETPLQRRLAQLGNVLFWGAIVVVIIVFLVGWQIQGIPWQEMFLIAVSLAVAAVPEGLPALVTIGLSLGAGRMVKRNALIRRLPAVETLGSVTVICSDKTGTLTKNEMTATFLALPRHHDVDVTGIGYTPEGTFTDELDHSEIDPHQDDSLGRFLKAMALSTNAYVEQKEGQYTIVGDTTEGALIIAAQKVGWTREKLEEDLPRINELPFNSERKAMTTVHHVVGDNAQRLFGTDSYISITKGAPDKLIGWATHEHVPDGRVELEEDRRQQWYEHVNMMAKQGLRVIGVAYRALDAAPEGELSEDIERNLILIGLVGIVDPARPEAKEAVKTARSAGIRSIMITGDHALTAEAIARNLGILEEGQHAITGNQLDEMTDEEISKSLETTSAFARVSPTHKLKLVKLLQQKGNIAAMTGDGVNDAPALKQADIGVAMGITGTDVSKGASEMVLTDDNFASIVAAIEEGRAIYDNIKKFIKYLLSSNVGEILVMFVALLVGMPVPLLAIQILWINLVTDGLPAIALGFEPAEEGVMERKPRHKDESVFAGGIGRHIILIGILIAILTLGGYIWGYNNIGVNVFNPENSVAELDSSELLALLDDYGFDEQDVIENLPIDVTTWDAASAEERLEFLGGHSIDDEGIELEGSSEGIVGLVERIPRSIAFTILAFTQMFEVMAIHAGDKSSFFRDGFKKNRLLLWAVLSTFILQLIVLYVPFMQTSFETAPINLTQMIVAFGVGSIVLFAVEIEKYFNRSSSPSNKAPATAQ